jgi:hypothetical protein
VHLLPPFVPAPREATSFDGIIGQGFVRGVRGGLQLPGRQDRFPAAPADLAQYHPLVVLAIANGPRFQELIHPLALADLRERCAVSARQLVVSVRPMSTYTPRRGPI